MRLTQGQKIFAVINYTVLTALALLTIYPFIYVLSASISSANDLYNGSVVLLPKNINFLSYNLVMNDSNIWMGYGNSIFYTVVGTLVSLLVTICGAYPLSKKRLRFRSFLSFMIMFTMWFNAGIIPFYLNIQELGLFNTRTGLIIAFACTAFNLILMRTYFQSIPDSLEEAALIDGANDLKILSHIYLPLSGPAIATVGLFYAVQRWNGYFWAMVLLRDDAKIPLQVLLKKTIVEVSFASEYSNMVDFTASYSKETVIYATIIISIIPMLILYPFIQRYFVSGIMIGAVKG